MLPITISSPPPPAVGGTGDGQAELGEERADEALGEDHGQEDGGDREGGGSWFVEFGLYMFFQSVLGLLGAGVTNSFSRWREYRADAGGARLAGKEQMISALRALQGTEDFVARDDKAFASLKISGQRSALAKLFATHPPLEERIERLRNSSAF